MRAQRLCSEQLIVVEGLNSSIRVIVADHSIG